MSLVRRNGFWFVVWSLLALGVLWQYDLLHYRLDDDASFMLYAGQQILRGVAPYVGVAIVKLPLSPLIAALGIGAGRLVGADDIVAGRIAFWLCAGITAGAVYLVGVQLARQLRQSKMDADVSSADVSFADVSSAESGARQLTFFDWFVGSTSAAILLSWQVFGAQVARGPEAKLPMICAGLFCVALLARRQFFWAGVAGALSFLAWQPGLVYCAAALLAALAASVRKRALIAAGLGIALPLVVVGVYLGANGALVSMYHQAFGANANYLGEQKLGVGVASVLGANAVKLWNVSLECSATEIPFLWLSLVGLVGGGVWLVWRLATRRAPQTFLDLFPLGLSAAALFGFSLLDLQKCSDVIPLMPYLALGAGLVLGAGYLGLARLIARTDAASPRAERILQAVGVIVLALVLLYGAGDAFTLAPQRGLEQERATAAQIEAQLAPDDAVQEFGNTGFLVITRRTNATRFIHLGEKQGLGIFTAEGISIDEVVAQVRAANPRVVMLSRAKNKSWAAPLYAWIQENYTPDAQYNASNNTRNKELEVFWRK